MIRIFLLILITVCASSFSEAQLFKRSGSYRFDSQSGSYRYRGKTYTLGVDGPVSSTCQCSMCRRLRAALQPQSQPLIYTQSPVVETLKTIPQPVLTAFDPSPHSAVEVMLDLADVGPGDVVFDPGCGDGRILIAAVKRGATAYGVEINKSTADKGHRKTMNIPNATVFHGDAITSEWYDANVITVYLYPEVIKKLVPRFLKTDPGTVVISHAHDIPGLSTERFQIDGVDFYRWVNGETWRRFSISENPGN